MLRPCTVKPSFRHQHIPPHSFAATPTCRSPSPRFSHNIRLLPRTGLMFRAQLLRRNFSLFNRVPFARIVRSAARDGHENVVIQRFRIRKPLFSRSRLVSSIIVVLALHGLTRYLGTHVEVRVVSEEEKGPGKKNEWQQAGQEVDGDDEEEDDDVGDVLLFLPTGFSRPAPTTFYKGSDPEWQEFKRIATDKARAAKIRGELVSLVRSTVAQVPQWGGKLGKIDTSKGKVWVEIKFPDSLPVEYERPGIALTEELEWVKATRPVEAAHHQRLERLLQPTHSASALYQDAKRRTSQSWQDLKAYFGWNQKAATPSTSLVLPPVGAMPLPSPSPSASSTGTTTKPAATSQANDTQPPTISPSHVPVDGPTSSLSLLLPDPKKVTMDLARIRLDMRKGAKQPIVVPRGAFYVRGLIEVCGTRARVTFSSTGVYDPKQGKYVGASLDVFNFVEHQQAPKGGP
ncbi:hypothetical protein T440DRAFT_504123 [Plenodomus tracheiphilus IPT5]|uniref:Uncharacterized protein n=1 Tax=Plenodomus tracheiphilus IPT5 TaxID=1408161 RepID=A0A6A7BIX9_9PLEO|nr:hypothetical protein T440DRAFT_504123 [Plenodomus tracheiphilus IPT5]